MAPTEPDNSGDGSTDGAVDAAVDAADLASTRRRRRTWISIAIVGVVSATALVAVPAIAADNDDPHGSNRVIVCQSDVVEEGDIRTSSASAERVADNDARPIPPGCRDERK
jgi:hypothetical protein